MAIWPSRPTNRETTILKHFPSSIAKSRFTLRAYLTNKNYVSFHLLYLYYNPAANKALSPALKKRMQGKACFNFTAVDEDCFAELGRLIGDGLKIYKSEEFQQTIKDMQ